MVRMRIESDINSAIGDLDVVNRCLITRGRIGAIQMVIAYSGLVPMVSEKVDASSFGARSLWLAPVL